MSSTREKRAIEKMECPRCKAWPGSPCYWRGKGMWSLPGTQGRLFIHPERRKAYQAWSAAQWEGV